ncbi:outer dense fiber protein 2b [Chanos chanos]|uniref:Outer dense fiber protein 2 n=1 Tax=Chanos chanos TaxID=29144 RepID=A0A6J2WD87_CHACN|nr:outer dense fiber protein 2-like [Chanos chanos]
MKNPSSSPPVHVHVPDTTPVHVHLRRSEKCHSKRDVGKPSATSTAKTRAPWRPPGKAPARRDTYKWEGSTHCLEITPVAEGGTTTSRLQLSDLSNEEDERGGIHGHISKYEKQIESLMSEVDSMKNEVKLRKKQDQLTRQSQHLSACQLLIDEQEEELMGASKGLEVSRRMNSDLKHTMDRIQEETEPHRPGAGPLEPEIETLLRKLVEAEIDGQAVAKQVSTLRETMEKVRKDKKTSKADSSTLGRHHEVLVQKLEAFDNTNRTLRQLLREQHGRETDALRRSDEREVLLRKLADSEAEKRRLEAKLSNKAKEASELAVNLESEKDQAQTVGELSKALESTHVHLQRQLQNKEAENNRLGTQIERMEGTLQRQQQEIQSLLEQMRELKGRCEMDRETQKQATHTHKQRAQQSQETATQLSAQLLEKETQLSEALLTAENLRQRHAKQVKEKNQLELEITTLNNRLTEMSDELRGAEEKARAEREGLLDRVHRLTSETTSTRLENQRLQTTLSATEERLALSHSEIQQLKKSVKDFENLVEGYKSQLHKTRLESEEYCLRLEMSEKETRSLQTELEREAEQVRKQLLGRVKELENLPETLKRAEEQLAKAREQNHLLERRNAEQSRILSELRLQVEEQGSKVETLQEKNLLVLEENKQLKCSMESTERKLEDTNAQNRDLLQVIAKREEMIHNTQLRLEEKSRECDRLTRQVDKAREEAQRQVEESLDRAFSKERSTQSKALDLETQLNLAKMELNQLKRNKEDMERRFQTKLQDMKNKLEQSDSSNRSLQNYVHYLKASYANVFGDSALTSSLHTHI